MFGTDSWQYTTPMPQCKISKTTKNCMYKLTNTDNLIQFAREPCSSLLWKELVWNEWVCAWSEGLMLKERIRISDVQNWATLNSGGQWKEQTRKLISETRWSTVWRHCDCDHRITDRPIWTQRYIYVVLWYDSHIRTRTSNYWTIYEFMRNLDSHILVWRCAHSFCSLSWFSLQSSSCAYHGITSSQSRSSLSPSITPSAFHSRLKLICFTNLFPHSLPGSIWTTFTDLEPVPN